MNIALINGSPKAERKSNSAILLRFLKSKLNSDGLVASYHFNRPGNSEYFQELCGMDTLVLSFPLYADAIPSHFFRTMVEFEAYRNRVKPQREIWVYVLMNNGFYEGRQCGTALRIVRHWCRRAGLVYAQGAAAGAGETLRFLKKTPLGHGPLENLGRAVTTLASNIMERKRGDDILFSPNMPRFFWQFMANKVFWLPAAKKNGLSRKDIYRAAAPR
jgi:hypothetical protein